MVLHNFLNIGKYTFLYLEAIIKKRSEIVLNN